MNKIARFFSVSPVKPLISDNTSELEKKYKRLKWSTFLAATFGYGMYYVCRLSLNVVKKPIVDEGIFSETELGIIGSVLFFTYAIGKFTNGFLADRSNINRFMTTGLLHWLIYVWDLPTHLSCLPFFGGLVVGFSLWELLRVWWGFPVGLVIKSVDLSMDFGLPAIT